MDDFGSNDVIHDQTIMGQYLCTLLTKTKIAKRKSRLKKKCLASTNLGQRPNREYLLARKKNRR